MVVNGKVIKLPRSYSNQCESKYKFEIKKMKIVVFFLLIIGACVAFPVADPKGTVFNIKKCSPVLIQNSNSNTFFYEFQLNIPVCLRNITDMDTYHPTCILVQATCINLIHISNHTPILYKCQGCKLVIVTIIKDYHISVFVIKAVLKL